MALKDADLETYYQDIFEMCGTRGWKHLQAQFGDMLKSHDTLVGLNSAEQMWFRKGQLDIIAQVINHQDMHEQAYNHLVAEETGGEAEAPTGGVATVIDERTMFE